MTVCKHLIRISFQRITRNFHLSSYYCQNNFYITTPIFYINGPPHIGHLYTVLLADVISRWRRTSGRNERLETFFSTGTDEHGSKIQKAAAEMNLTPAQLTFQNSEIFRNFFNKSNISYTAFMRTSLKEHKIHVRQFWTTLVDKGYIFRDKYKGWYSFHDETFLSDRDIKKTINGERISMESGHKVEWIEEEGYMFKLSCFKNEIRNWLISSDVIVPTKFAQMVLKMIDEGVCNQDLSISRPSSKVNWAIEVPDDSDHTIYVWVDALINYIHGGPWPANLQIVGKDILKFHAIYWPALLLAAGKPLPNEILCHGHWTVNGRKMSKSLDNSVCPVALMEKYPIDGVRFYLMKEGVFDKDNDFCEKRLIESINLLANVYGNTFQRVVNPNSRHSPTKFPSFFSTTVKELSGEYLSFFHSISKLPQLADQYYSSYQPYKVIDATHSVLTETNQFLQHTRFWKFLDQPHYCSTIFHIVLESLRVCSLCISPIVPLLTSDFFERVSIYPEETVFNVKDFQPGFFLDQNPAWVGRPIRIVEEPLIKRIEISTFKV